MRCCCISLYVLKLTLLDLSWKYVVSATKLFGIANKHTNNRGIICTNITVVMFLFCFLFSTYSLEYRATLNLDYKEFKQR